MSDSLLETFNVSMSFGGVQALDDVSVSVRAGEITALVGDNGAGKSTLVRCICGIHRPESGSIRFEDGPADFATPEDARRAGVETVHQNLALVEDLTVWQNLFLNREIVKRAGPFAFLDRKAMRSRANEMISTLAVNVPEVTSRVRRLSGGQRQAISICRAAGFSSKLVIMDEPTAALGIQETTKVEELITRLRDDGHAVLLVSHDFAQVMRLSQQVWVMRAGRCVANRAIADTTGEEIVGLVTGAVAS